MSTLISPEHTRIGWIGAGVMGASMCGHVARAGYPVTIFSRTKSKASALLKSGVQWAPSPGKVAQQSDVVISIVGFPDQVRDIYLGDEGIIKHARPGAVLVDMTTSRPSLAEEIAKVASQRELTALDAPVSGGDVGAREARLSIMVGGDEPTFHRLEPLWQILGKNFTHLGKAGAGQHTKMVNQTLIATTMIGVCEALLYAHKAGLDLGSVLRAVSTGAAGSWSLTNYAPRMLEGDFKPGFFVEHFLKDMQIALQEAARMKLSLPGLALAHQLYIALQAQGHGKDGTHALQLAVASLSGIDWTKR